MSQLKKVGIIISSFTMVFSLILGFINYIFYVNVIPYSYLISFFGIQLSSLIHFIRKDVGNRFFYGYLLLSILHSIFLLVAVPHYTYEQAVEAIVAEIEEQFEVIPLSTGEKRTPRINSYTFIAASYYILLRPEDGEDLHFIFHPERGEYVEYEYYFLR
ncbi:hypothetical protein [Bacillus horti]|uniref:Uncharacterized protein YpmB n=1 Tax=Caldalkalibacillus horti TaxID=77523 RepID=A0ABT9VUU2_9BACI|nr:hypothetical protein [Bacillus horti]MDQ0164741.1 uncharacterized protein YpmB [Bacillus horti]